jgi:hypothetical protein
MNTARFLANYNHARKGYQACMCPMCWAPGDQRKFAKGEWNRAIRRSESAQINDEIRDDADHDGDASFRMYQMRLTLDNAGNLRSVDWDY